MRIKFMPINVSDDRTLKLEKSAGNRLRINGELFNFNPLNPGDVIPYGSIPCEWIAGPVEHVDDHVTVILLLPYRVGNRYVETPEPLIVNNDGMIGLPEIEEPANVDT